jgi:hypothetical protein
MKIVVAGVCTMLSAAILVGAGFTAVGEKASIKEVMLEAHKKGLLKKVAGGKGDKADAEKLLKLYTDLAANKPPAGEAADWKTKTDAIVAAAKEVVAGKEGAGKALTKAVNCGACHKAHKG